MPHGARARLTITISVYIDSPVDGRLGPEPRGGLSGDRYGRPVIRGVGECVVPLHVEVSPRHRQLRGDRMNIGTKLAVTRSARRTT